MFYSIDEAIKKSEAKIERLDCDMKATWEKRHKKGDASIGATAIPAWRKEKEDTHEKLQQLYWLREVRDSK